MNVTSRRKKRHIEVCLEEPVEYELLTTGFERWRLPYRALPEADLNAVDLSVELLGRRLRAPLLIGAMTGGSELSARINRNLAEAAQRCAVGLMLGSQRVMIERPEVTPSFRVREVAPDILLLGNLGLVQLLLGYGVEEMRQAVEAVGADALALHANPLQEALQEGGDTNFSGALARLSELLPRLPFPVLLKEVGHGLSARVAREAAAAGVAALDLAGAGGTSWAKVEQYARWGEVRHPQLAEWGIPTAEALRSVASAGLGLPLIASGGIRSGVDVAKAVALGASACAVARPLLAPAIESADAVVEALERLIFELRVAAFCCGVQDLSELARVDPEAVPS
ncbi:MAG TPA: type 2 isopentenyl-diphosphate Delta-isomerase [Trueperaceae bacterium]